MALKRICFRFDIDSPKCLEVGVPNLLRLAQEKNVRFSFLVNCGRSIDLALSLRDLLAASPTHKIPAHLSARRKMGNLRFLQCALFNPVLSTHFGSLIQEIQKEGHEVGLHGGRNHERWAKEVHTWSETKIRQEIDWGLDRLRALGIVPEVFGSPCARSDERVRRILRSYPNFKFISDRLEPEQYQPHCAPDLIPDLPVALCGDGGVAFVEQQIALKRAPEEVRTHLVKRLARHSVQIIYDHPYLAGDEGLPLTAQIIDWVKAEGFEFGSLAEIGDAMLSLPTQTKQFS